MTSLEGARASAASVPAIRAAARALADDRDLDRAGHGSARRPTRRTPAT